MNFKFSRRQLLKTSGVAGATLSFPAVLTSTKAWAHDTDKPLKIGSGFPLTNYAASDGEAMKLGSALAIEEINARGGVCGRPIEQIVLDMDIDSPEGTSATLTRLIDEKVDGFVMGYYTPSKFGADIAASYGKPLSNEQASLSQAEFLAADPEKYYMVFPMDTPETSYGEAFIPFLNGLESAEKWKPSARTIMQIRGDSVYSQTIGDALVNSAEGTSWEIIDPQEVIAPVNDWGAVLNNVRSAKPGVIFVTHWHPSQLAVLVKQFVANPTNSLVYLQYGPSVPEFLELAGKKANGFVWASNTGILQDDIGKNFVKSYVERWGQDPGASIAGLAYDQVYMLARAWMESDPADGKAVSAAMRRMIHRGVNGGYHFGTYAYPRGFPAEVNDPSIGIPHPFYQIQNGEHRLIAPSPYDVASFEPGPWQS